MQIEFQRAPLLQVRIHVGLEEAEAAAPVGLGAIQRDVGVLQQLCRRSAPSAGTRAMPMLAPIMT